MEDEVEWTPNWLLEPVWQNYSSMYREAVSAEEASNGMEVAHHRMATLYFGISTLECFLNRAMTGYLLQAGNGHDEIYDVLWKSSIKDKLKKWPKQVLGADLQLRPGSMDCLLAANDLRGQLTHLKNFWPEAFEELDKTSPMSVVDLVAEFIICYSKANDELFPYWVWGWNYLSPGAEAHEMALIPYTQFLHSIRALGYKFDREKHLGFDDRAKAIMSDYAGYREVANFLATRDKCEARWVRAPLNRVLAVEQEERIDEERQIVDQGHVERAVGLQGRLVDLEEVREVDPHPPCRSGSRHLIAPVAQASIMQPSPAKTGP